jgi:hypothetical protein
MQCREIIFFFLCGSGNEVREENSECCNRLKPSGLLTYLLTRLLTYLLAYLLTCLLTYLLTYLPTYLLTPCSTVLLEKLTGSQLVKKFPAFYGTRTFITAFTRARHLSLSCSPGPRHIFMFRNKASFNGEELAVPRRTPKLEDHSLSDIRDCLFNTFAATLHI